MQTGQHHDPRSSPPTPSELRIAVAMRGGVSLAVWMGGACSEIVRLRNAARDGDDPYSRLLDILDYDTVTVDVISGSSAGGLNGALLALHLAYGMPFGEQVRDLWLQVGDLEQLTRSPSAPHPPSLLKGDEEDGFYGRLRDACLKLLEQVPSGHRPARFLRLVLTATRLHARTLPVHQTLGEPLHASRARAYFRFQHRSVDGAAPVVTDFGPDGPDGVADRLAYAARTTSSFPGAFAPARIWVADAPDATAPRTFAGQSSETGAGDDGTDTVELIDGGLLDNIPIAWAIRAIAAAPASRPVDRWLVYLQPVEPQPAPGDPVLDEPGTRQGRQRRVTRLVRLLLAAATRRMDSESLLDDAEELHDAATTARRLRGLAASGIPQDPEAVLRDDRRVATYRQLVGLADAARLAELMKDPGTVLGPDPLPLPGDRPEIDTAVLTGLADADTVADLAAAAPAPSSPSGPTREPGADPAEITHVRGPFALARTVSLLLDWVRAAETYRQLPPKRAGELRDQLYSARLAAELLVGLRDRIVLPHFDAAKTAADLVELVRRATWQLQAAFGDEWRIPDGTSWRAWRDRLFAIAAQPLPDDVPDGWPQIPYAPFWDELAGLGVAIGQGLLGDVAGPPGFDLLRETAVAEPVTGGAHTAMRRVLAATELMLGPIRTDPFTEPSTVNFHAVTASRANPVEERIFGKMLPPAERADRKLSGNQLSNFAAFLSARWRHTDWSWGRLDAVPSLVELMVGDGHRLARFTDAELLAELEALYLAGPAEQAGVRAAEWARLSVTAADVRERFAAAVADRLQLGVLTDELPVLRRLHDRGPDRDLPPAPHQLTDLPPAPLSDASLMAEVGDEKLPGLLHRFHARRTATRVGLVGWRAVQPGGTGFTARLARLAFGLLKPLALIPVLAAVASPVASIFAAFGAWLLVAAVARTWSSPVTLPVLAIGFAVTAAIVTWRLRLGKGWTIAGYAAGAALAVGPGGALLSPTNQIWDIPGVRYAAVIVGVLAAVAPFWWLLASRTPGAVVLGLLIALQLLVLGTVIALDAWGPPAWLNWSALGEAGGWLSGPPLALLALYAVLSVPAILLTLLFPKPPA
ncbi:MAG: DUF3376 domain-containing protein [Micromonosporaceae bacterium]